MKVLILAKHEVTHYGVAEVIRGLAAALRRIGLEARVYSSDPSARIGELPDGTPCHWGPIPRPGGVLEHRKIRSLVRYCHDEGVDVIHCQSLYRPGFAAMLAKRKTGIPFVLTSQGDLFDPSGRNDRPRVRRRLRLIFDECSAVASLTRGMADVAERLGAEKHKSHVIPNGIDLDWWRQPTSPPAGEYILGLGRFVPVKGFDVLIETLRLLRDRQQRLSLVLAGDGPMREQMAARAAELGFPVIDRVDDLAASDPWTVCFPGFVDGAAKRDLLAGAKIFAFPTRSDMPEGFPNVLLQALAAGRAIVASRVQVTREELVDGENGRLVPEGDSAAWAEAIASLNGDERLRVHCEQTNAQLAEEFDWPVLARRHLDLYEAALADAYSAGIS